jgi:hypothetical protein
VAVVGERGRKATKVGVAAAYAQAAGGGGGSGGGRRSVKWRLGAEVNAGKEEEQPAGVMLNQTSGGLGGTGEVGKK